MKNIVHFQDTWSREKFSIKFHKPPSTFLNSFCAASLSAVSRLLLRIGYDL